VALLPVHEVHHAAEAYQIFPAYPEQQVQDYVLVDHRGCGGGCHECGQVVSGSDCGCRSHGQPAHQPPTRYGFRSAF
jgi:hypothetical protein